MKAPSCRYDIVSVSGVLSKYEFVRDDPRFLEMIKRIKGKQDKDGLFTPESVYLKWVILRELKQSYKYAYIIRKYYFYMLNTTIEITRVENSYLNSKE